jgi:hypothetical protein
LVDSPLVGDVNLDTHPGYTIGRIREGTYDLLSSGEKRLVDIAASILAGTDHGVGIIGGLDRDRRRKVLLTLAYFYLGRDVPIAFGAEEFADAFGGRQR